ncbi:hypothetical protein [Parasphingorhabdus halotolerans]|uniref:Uncharacterized protein n=1 Tax=Parasphingorhabdus halotolerans TaxID=2725558 RepID=A0A6H2DP33_9SPHN|nr:hypothetical protein [Parasphingorhabdus halotolerans]QJB69897.1 hypothetical protein HF685_11890 [Parasphingorhabdus halotolerans]
MSERELETRYSPDRESRIIFISRTGLVHYELERMVRDDFIGGEIWEPCGESGLYLTLAEAIADAKKEVPWMRDNEMN